MIYFVSNFTLNKILLCVCQFKFNSVYGGVQRVTFIKRINILYVKCCTFQKYHYFTSKLI